MENIKLKDKFIDEKTGIEYIRKGDFYLVDLSPQQRMFRIIVLTIFWRTCE